jgi:two-component sensor histidine kinase
VLRITEGSGPGVDAEEILKQADLRLSTFGTAHELLYRLDGGASSRLDQYLDEIAKNALTACTDSPVDLDLKLEPVVVHLSRMIPCGLIVNELVTNACKYAFPAGSRGTIALHLCVAGDGRQRTLRLMVSDDGVGLPTDHEGHGGLGLSLVRSLCKQIHGTLTVDGAGGTTVYLEFPISDSD